MKYSKGTLGRIFIVSFEHGDDFLEGVKELAKKESIAFATVMFIGALKRGDIVSGPEKPAIPPVPIRKSFDDAREILGLGTISKDGSGSIHVHLHANMGRDEKSLTGCLRENCETFITIEAVVTELTHTTVSKKEDPETGLNLLSFRE